MVSSFILWSLSLMVSATIVIPLDLIGKIVPPDPSGLHEQSGTCVSDMSRHEYLCNHSIMVFADSAGNTLYVVAGLNAGHSGQKGLTKITDAVPYPPLVKNYYMQIAACRLNGSDDNHIVAYVRDQPGKEFLTDVSWARRLDFDSGKLLKIDPKTVDCHAFGDED